MICIAHGGLVAGTEMFAVCAFGVFQPGSVPWGERQWGAVFCSYYMFLLNELACKQIQNVVMPTLFLAISVALKHTFSK